jgi:hypothetical protein
MAESTYDFFLKQYTYPALTEDIHTCACASTTDLYLRKELSRINTSA